jgi:hypothetical protein
MCRDTAARSDFSNTYLIHIVGQQIDQVAARSATGGLGWLISGEDITHACPSRAPWGWKCIQSGWSPCWTRIHHRHLRPAGHHRHRHDGVYHTSLAQQSNNELHEAVHKAQAAAAAKDEFWPI